MNILIVDDEPTNLKLLRAQLEAEGHSVDEAPDGVEALAQLERREVDAVISDILMPRMDGYRLCHAIRQHQRLSDLPVVIYTATYTSPGDEVLARDVGADKYLKKPASTETIIAALREVVARPRALPRARALQEADVLKEYSERLVKKLEQRNTDLIAAESKFRILVEHSVVGIYIIQEDRLVYVNPRMAQLFGWSEDEMTSRDVFDFIASEDHDLARENLRKRISGEVADIHYELRMLHQSGAELQVEVHGARADYKGRPAVMGTLLDLTERKKFEQQYLRAQRMESIGTLASGVAHDLNNILAPIMMSVPFLREQLSDEQREGIISTIEESAARGAQIVKQVLTFGRGLEGQKHPLQIGGVIAEIMKIMRGTFSKDIIVESSTEPDLWTVIGDSTQLHQVLLNLCVNARDAMPNGGKLRLHTANLDIDASYASMLPEAAPGPHVLLEASDTGTGIAPEVVERIFDPFFTTKGVGLGTGLGLSTVLGIVKSHGGFLHVKTQPGKGTTFQVFLPAVRDLEAASADSSPSATLQGQGELVLVVDDEVSVRKSARMVLEIAGYRVLLAADGTEALAAFAANSTNIAAVLTDLMMPLMDGLALIRALRSMAPKMPIIASTGLGEKAQLAELKVLGVEGVLRKPYNADALLCAIQGALHPPSTI